MNMAGGDNDEDDNAAGPLWDGADDGVWHPPAWSKSAPQLEAEARSLNMAAHASVAAAAGKHSNLPAWDAGRSL